MGKKSQEGLIEYRVEAQLGGQLKKTKLPQNFTQNMKKQVNKGNEPIRKS